MQLERIILLFYNGALKQHTTILLQRVLLNFIASDRDYDIILILHSVFFLGMSSHNTLSSTNNTVDHSEEPSTPFPAHHLTSSSTADGGGVASAAAAAAQPEEEPPIMFRRYRRNALVLSDDPALLATLAAAFGSARPDTPPEEELGTCSSFRVWCCKQVCLSVPSVF